MKRLFHYALLFLLSFAQPATAFWEDDEILPVEEAFALSTEIEGNSLKLTWSIQDGYYLYKTKIKVQSNTPGVDIGAIRLPNGEIKQDEFFGEVEIYHGTVSATAPVSVSADAPPRFDLYVTSQGCAERGICYPPHSETISLATPAVSKTPAQAEPDAFQQLSALGNDFGFGDEQDFLPVEQAFKHEVAIIDGNTLAARWQIAEGYYLYKDRISFALVDAAGIALGDADFPKGKMKDDPEFGRVETYSGELVINIPLQRQVAEAMDIELVSKYQGCAEAGLCYPPQTTTTALSLPSGSTEAADVTPVAAETGGSDLDSFSRTLAEGSLVSILIAALGAGLLLAFTACMYPMIPILSSIIVGQGEQATVTRSITLTLVYVESMAITFAVIGAIIGSFSDAIGIQALFQKPIFLIPFSILFILLALSMFGFFNIQMPAAIQSRINQISNEQKSGSFIGVFIMGALSALIIGPCGGPILVAALSYAASAGPVNGALAMFALGNGMGLPLLLVGASGGKLLPKAGDWMNTVKAVAGVILLAVAILFLSRMPDIFSPMLIMLMWATLLITSGIYMGALEPLPIESSGWSKFWKGLGVVIVLYGAVVLIGGLSGARDVTNPLHGSKLLASGGSVAVAATESGSHEAVAFQRIKTVADLEKALADARAAGKPVMLDYYADWCTYCIQYEEYVFPTAPVREALKDYVLLQADVTATDAEDKALMRHTNVVLPPAILFYDRNGQEQRALRVVGTMKAEAFAAHVNKANGR